MLYQNHQVDFQTNRISPEGLLEARNTIMHFHHNENYDVAKARLSKARDFIRKLVNEIEEYD